MTLFGLDCKGSKNHPCFFLLIPGIQIKYPFLWSGSASSMPSLELQVLFEILHSLISVCPVSGVHGECWAQCSETSARAGCAPSISFLAEVGEKRASEIYKSTNHLLNCVRLRKRCRIEIVSSGGSTSFHLPRKMISSSVVFQKLKRIIEGLRACNYCDILGSHTGLGGKGPQSPSHLTPCHR